MYSSIFDYIRAEETNYKLPVNIMDWEWSMSTHIKTSFFYKHGRLTTGNSDDKPVKNITRPILNLQYRTEDIDVKDVFLYVDNPEKYYLSFLVKKYHDDVFIKEHNLDELFDDLNISRVDYGGGLAKKSANGLPEYTPLESIVFCDQTDLLSGPIGIKHYYSPDQLKAMESVGWGGESADITVDELIILGQDQKKGDKGETSKTPGKYIEVYEVHGNLPERFLDPDADQDKYVSQIQIVSFYINDSGDKQFVTLFKGKEKPNQFKLAIRDKIYGRALGFGGVEELFESQVWVNYDIIRMKDLLDSAAKIIMATDDPGVAARHPGGLKNLDNLEIVELDEGKTLRQVDTFPRNIQLFDRSIADWESHAQQTGAANDSILGENPSSGTPFKLQELVTQESRGLHEYRKGKFAKFLEELYRDWIIPYITKEITKGQKFLADLSFEEMETIGQQVVDNVVNREIKEKILNGQNLQPEEIEALRLMAREEFMKDNKKFIEILKGELNDAPLAIKINIAGKQHDLARQVDKLVNVFRQIAAAPQILDDPRMAKLFNQILESSGLSPIDFGSFKRPDAQQMGQPQMGQAQPVASTEPAQQLAEANQ
jgi:hypothetical protein